MSGKWNPVLLSTGQHPRYGPIRWTNCKSILCRLVPNWSVRPILPGATGSNGGFGAVIADGCRSALGRLPPDDSRVEHAH